MLRFFFLSSALLIGIEHFHSPQSVSKQLHCPHPHRNRITRTGNSWPRQCDGIEHMGTLDSCSNTYFYATILLWLQHSWVEHTMSVLGTLFLCMHVPSWDLSDRKLALSSLGTDLAQTRLILVWCLLCPLCSSFPVSGSLGCLSVPECTSLPTSTLELGALLIV